MSGVTPNTGSENGGILITVSGNGFVVNKTTVTVGGTACDVKSVTLSSLKCMLPAGTGSAAVVQVAVQSSANSQTYSTVTFNYDTTLTPTINSVTPNTGNTGDTITIAGSGFTTTASDVSVKVIDHFRVIRMDSQTTDITHFAVVFHYDVTIKALETLQSTANYL